MSGLQIDQVRKSFGPQAVLRGVDLSVPEGTFCSILGPSGSGKTTLLRLISGFERLDGGSIALDGVVLDDARHFVSPEQRRVGYVPQEGSLFPHLSVAANVGFGLGRRERRRRAARVDELLAMVGLEGLGRRYPHQLSGGQQQRVALARALAVRPSMVLLDEPFSSLDAALREVLRQDVKRVLAEAGTTALLVTHDQNEALSLADQVAVIRDGRIGQAGTPQALYTQPTDPDLASFLGATNLVTGVIVAGGVQTCLGVLPLDHPDGASPVSADPGDEVLVLVRPEQMEIGRQPAPAGRPGAASDAAGALRGEVVSYEYYGHDAVVRVRSREAGPASPLTVRLSRASVWEPGTEVGVSAHGPVRVWPASGPRRRDEAAGMTPA